MEKDPIIAEVRENRETLLKRFNYDLDKLYAYIKDREEKSKIKLKNFRLKRDIKSSK